MGTWSKAETLAGTLARWGSSSCSWDPRLRHWYFGRSLVWFVYRDFWLEIVDYQNFQLSAFLISVFLGIAFTALFEIALIYLAITEFLQYLG